MSASETFFVAVILIARLLLPLLIFRYPLPAIVACLVLDAADQTILQKTTDLALTEGYQSADKALDIYYLTIAYCSVLRNWTNGTAVEVARFLWYYRLVGVALFEILGYRWLLLVFPNTFEYFFIAYEAVRLLWDPRRMPRRTVIALAAFIWIVIKLPQEWWIHVAQNDFTDFMADNPWAWGVIAVAALVVLAIGTRMYRAAPPPDWRWRFSADAPLPHIEGLTSDEPPLRWAGFEQLALLTLIVVIFSNVLNIDARFWQVLVGVVLVIAATGAVSRWLEGRGDAWIDTGREFVVLALVNVVLIGVYAQVVGDGLDRWLALFFGLLLTLIITSYDRCRAIRAARQDATPGGVVLA
jgi:hypothetical protein